MIIIKKQKLNIILIQNLDLVSLNLISIQRIVKDLTPML